MKYNYYSFLIDRFPEEVTHHIISYTYTLQNKHLVADVENFSSSLYTTYKLYNDYLLSFNEIYRIEYDKFWFINDLIDFSNSNQRVIDEHGIILYYIFYRNPFLYTKQLVDKYVKKLHSKNINFQIRTLWGLLFPEERNTFIELMNGRVGCGLVIPY
jgi:hypothetical protein